MKGFTLIEVLITAGIFIIILVIIANVIILGNRVYWEEEKAKEIMQNGRIVLDSISREVRQSRRIINSLPDEDCDNPLDEDCPPNEIIFQDGHLGINTSYYYIHYYLEDGFIQRKTFSFYFSGNPYDYVPFNAVPPDGETIEIEELENPRIIGEHFKDIKFWGSRVINISLNLELKGKEIKFFQKIFGRNL